MDLESTETSEIEASNQLIAPDESLDMEDGRIDIAQESLDEQYYQFKSIVEQSLKSSGDDQSLVLNSLLEIFFLPSRLHDSKYWKLLFKLCGRLRSLKEEEGGKELKIEENQESVESHPYSDVALLAHHISHQGFHKSSISMWKRYLEAVEKTGDEDLLLVSLEGLLSVGIDGGSELIGEYMKEGVFSTLDEGHLKRKEELKRLSEKKIGEEWKTLPDELKSLIMIYASSESLEEESIKRIDEEELPSIGATESSEQTFRLICHLCDRASSLASERHIEGSENYLGTLGLDPKVYFLQRAVEYAFKSKSYLLARRLVLYLSSLLLRKYRSLESISSSSNSDDIQLGPKINGFCFLQLFLDLRAFFDAEILLSDSHSVDNILVSAHFVCEFYGPTLELDTREKSSGAAKLLLLDYVASCVHINPLPAPEIVRSIIYFTQIELGRDTKASDSENDIFIDLCLSEWIAFLSSYDSSSPSSQQLIDQAQQLYLLAINREKSKLSKIDSSDLPSLNSRLSSLLEEMMKPSLCQSNIHMSLLALDTWKRTLKNNDAFSRLYNTILPHFKDSPIDMALIDAIKASNTQSTSKDAQKPSNSNSSINSLPSPSNSLSQPFRPSLSIDFDPSFTLPSTESKKRKRLDHDSEFSDLMPSEKAPFDEKLSSSPSSSTPILSTRFYPPSLPQHDEKFSLSANLVNALLPRQRALINESHQNLTSIDSETETKNGVGEANLDLEKKHRLSGSNDIISLEEQQKQYLSRKKKQPIKKIDEEEVLEDGEDQNFSDLIKSALNAEQRKKLVALLKKDDLYIFVKKLELSQNEVEVEMERERKLLEFAHAQRRSDTTSGHQHKLEEYTRLHGESDLSDLVAVHTEELENLETEISQEIDKFELKRDMALKEKIANQQQVMQAFGVPGFYKTMDHDALALQREILILIQNMMSSKADMLKQAIEEGKIKVNEDGEGKEGKEGKEDAKNHPYPDSTSSNNNTTTTTTSVFIPNPTAASELLKHVEALRSHYLSKMSNRYPTSTTGGSVGGGPGAVGGVSSLGMSSSMRPSGSIPTNLTIHHPPHASHSSHLQTPTHHRSSHQNLHPHHQTFNPPSSAAGTSSIHHNGFQRPNSPFSSHQPPYSSKVIHHPPPNHHHYHPPPHLIRTLQPPSISSNAVVRGPPSSSSSSIQPPHAHHLQQHHHHNPLQHHRPSPSSPPPSFIPHNSSHFPNPSSYGHGRSPGIIHHPNNHPNHPQSSFPPMMGPPSSSSSSIISPQKQFQTMERLRYQLEARLGGGVGGIGRGGVAGGMPHNHHSPSLLPPHHSTPNPPVHQNQNPFSSHHPHQSQRPISNEEVLQDLQRQLEAAEHKKMMTHRGQSTRGGYQSGGLGGGPGGGAGIHHINANPHHHNIRHHNPHQNIHHPAPPYNISHPPPPPPTTITQPFPTSNAFNHHPYPPNLPYPQQPIQHYPPNMPKYAQPPPQQQQPPPSAFPQYHHNHPQPPKYHSYPPSY